MHAPRRPGRRPRGSFSEAINHAIRQRPLKTSDVPPACEALSIILRSSLYRAPWLSTSNLHSATHIEHDREPNTTLMTW